MCCLGCPPAQDSSHHQDCYVFRIGDPELNLHLPLLLGGETHPMCWDEMNTSRIKAKGSSGCW